MQVGSPEKMKWKNNLDPVAAKLANNFGPGVENNFAPPRLKWKITMALDTPGVPGLCMLPRRPRAVFLKTSWPAHCGIHGLCYFINSIPTWCICKNPCYWPGEHKRTSGNCRNFWCSRKHHWHYISIVKQAGRASEYC